MNDPTIIVGSKTLQMTGADAARVETAKARAAALGLAVYMEEPSGRLVVGEPELGRAYLAGSDSGSDLDRIEAALDILEDGASHAA